MNGKWMDRREFLKHCGAFAALLGGAEPLTGRIAYGFKRLATADRPLVMFIQGQACTGCSISLTYGNKSDFLGFIMQIIRLQAHPNLSFAQGESYEKIIDGMIEKGGFYLVLEGSIPRTMKEACWFHGKPLYDSLETAMRKASAVLLSGTCASSGGIPAAANNPTGAISGEAYIMERQIDTPYIKIPGCPAHPDRLMGTVAYVAAEGKLPELKNGAPRMYFDETVHDRCSKFGHFNQNGYCYELGKVGCLLKKGCRGTITEADCPSRRWNLGVNVCIDSGTPCIGCVHPAFPFVEDMYVEPHNISDPPWYKLKEQI